jgi:hypothetical protein
MCIRINEHPYSKQAILKYTVIQAAHFKTQRLIFYVLCIIDWLYLN